MERDDRRRDGINISRSNIDLKSVPKNVVCTVEWLNPTAGERRPKCVPNSSDGPNGVPKCVKSLENVRISTKFVKNNPKRVPKNANLSQIMQARALAEICPEIRDRVPLVTSTPSNPEKRPEILHIWGHFPG